MVSLQQWLVILVLSLLSAMTWWLSHTTEPNDIVKSNDQHFVDYYMEEANILITHEDGRPKQRVVSPYLQHFADDDTVEMSTPHITVFKQSTPPWEIDADTGWLSSGAEQIILGGPVDMVRKASEQHRAMRVITRDLDIDTKTNFAQTPHHAIIHSDDSHQEGVGMDVWFDEPMHLIFQSQARGHYVRQ